ncbi:NUDIX hydrolase domain-like protein, partial [Mariannaea sp. PMI_226]
PPSGYTISPSLAPYTSHPSSLLKANPSIDNLLAGAVVTNASNQVLILRRSPTDSWPLKWEVPGGSVDIPGDASMVDAAVRELWEESGLVATSVKAAVHLHPSAPARIDEATNGDGTPKEEGETQVEMLDDLVVFRETGNTWAKLTAWMDVKSCDEVVVREDEHVEWAWVTEEEARTCKFADGRELDFVSASVRLTVLEGFRLWEEEKK